VWCENERISRLVFQFLRCALKSIQAICVDKERDRGLCNEPSDEFLGFSQAADSWPDSCGVSFSQGPEQAWKRLESHGPLGCCCKPSVMISGLADATTSCTVRGT